MKKPSFKLLALALVASFAFSSCAVHNQRPPRHHHDHNNQGDDRRHNDHY